MLGRLFQYRFPQGQGLAGHALGNLVIAALADITGGFPQAIEEAGRLLGARGRVLPSTLDDVWLHATDAAGRPVSGQARIAVSDGPVTQVRFEPGAPAAYAPAVDAIRDADVIVIGPGSLFTSIVPNLLVPGILDALRGSAGRLVYVCNVANQRGETSGMDAADHLQALVDHGLGHAVDTVVVHQTTDPAAEATSVAVCEDGEAPKEVVGCGRDVVARMQAMGVTVVLEDVVDPRDDRHHSYEKLCRVLGRLVG